MASQFQDLAEILDPFLPLPIRGKTYRIASPDVNTGLRAQATVAIAAKVRAGQDVDAADIAALKLDDAEELEFTRSMLGEAFDEMQTDDLPWEYVRHAAKTVFMWLISDRDQAAQVWASLGNDPRPVPQDRKAPAKKKSANGGKTKKASSRSSSTSRRTPASRGTASSATGS
jgi:hypothetical protein